MGFESTRAEHNGLAVHRLNHSATSSCGNDSCSAFNRLIETRSLGFLVDLVCVLCGLYICFCFLLICSLFVVFFPCRKLKKAPTAKIEGTELTERNSKKKDTKQSNFRSHSWIGLHFVHKS